MINQDEILTQPSALLRASDDPMPCLASNAFASMSTTAHCVAGALATGSGPQPGSPATCSAAQPGSPAASTAPQRRLPASAVQRLATATVRRLQATANWLYRVAADVAQRFDLEDEIHYDELDHMLSWSLSSRLAATSPSTLPSLPEHLAWLIEQAKELHPRMAEGALRRDRASEQP